MMPQSTQKKFSESQWEFDTRFSEQYQRSEFTSSYLKNKHNWVQEPKDWGRLKGNNVIRRHKEEQMELETKTKQNKTAKHDSIAWTTQILTSLNSDWYMGFLIHQPMISHVLGITKPLWDRFWSNIIWISVTSNQKNLNWQVTEGPKLYTALTNECSSHSLLSHKEDMGTAWGIR